MTCSPVSSALLPHREEHETHGKVRIVPRILVNLALDAQGERLADVLASCGRGPERSVEVGWGVVVPDERVFAQRCENVHELNESYVSWTVRTRRDEG